MARLKRPSHATQSDDSCEPYLPLAQERLNRDCDCKHDDLPRIADCGLDPIDVLIIDIVRCICAGFASGDCAHWDAACDRSEFELGAIDGPSFVARTISLMRAVRRERQGGFGFMTPGCSYISEHELLVITLIRAARQRRTDDFASAMAKLASIPKPTHIAVAASSLAGLCVRHEALCNQNITSRDHRALN